MVKKIGVIVGSLRQAAWTGKVADAVKRLAPSDWQLQTISIHDLPLYNEDSETTTPPSAWVRFRKAVQPMHAILFVTPEYNRSIPAPLKNAIDVGSRPYGSSVWQRKPCAIISSSPGAIGGFGANHHLRQALACLNAPCLPGEILLSGVDKLFEADGITLNQSTHDFLKKFTESYDRWIQMHS